LISISFRSPDLVSSWRVEGGPAAGIAAGNKTESKQMSTLINWLEAGRDGWPEHILWFALLLLIVARGPGAISLDHLIWNRAQLEPAPVR
jgi:hypothetical protein